MLSAIAERLQDTLASYKEQLSTTHMFYTAPSAVEMTNSAQLKKTMELVRQFCFSHGLLGDKTSSPDDVAIRFPDGAIQGKPDRVRLRFDASYMKLPPKANCEDEQIVSVLRIHAQPSRTTVWILSWFLFAAGVVSYFSVSRERHRENPDDRVMPTLRKWVRVSSTLR